MRLFDPGLSVGGARKVAAKEAYGQRRAVGLSSGRELTAGTWAESVAEVGDVGLRAVDDSVDLGPEAPQGHAYLDYRHIAELDSRRAARSEYGYNGRSWHEVDSGRREIPHDVGI